MFAGLDSFFEKAKPESAGECASVTNTNWLYGQDSKVKWCSSTRNGLAQLKYQAASGVVSLIFTPHSFPVEFQELAFDDVSKRIQDFGIKELKRFIDHKCVHLVEHEQETVLYIPTASIVCEFSVRQQSLVFGLRKPMILRGLSHCKSYSWLMAAFLRSEKSIGKMSDALVLMKVPDEQVGKNDGAEDASKAKAAEQAGKKVSAEDASKEKVEEQAEAEKKDGAEDASEAKEAEQAGKKDGAEDASKKKVEEQAETEKKDGAGDASKAKEEQAEKKEGAEDASKDEKEDGAEDASKVEAEGAEEASKDPEDDSLFAR